MCVKDTAQQARRRGVESSSDETCGTHTTEVSLHRRLSQSTPQTQSGHTSPHTLVSLHARRSTLHRICESSQHSMR
eukprot:3920546-Rhodomonas_salina.1